MDGQCCLSYSRGRTNLPYVAVNPLGTSFGSEPSCPSTTGAKLEKPKSASFSRPRTLRMLSGLMSACQLVHVSKEAIQLSEIPTHETSNIDPSLVEFRDDERGV